MEKIVRHINIWFKSFQSFGFSGLLLAIRMLYFSKSKKRDRSFKLKGLKNKIYLRLNSSDFSCYTDIFLDKSYKTDLTEPEWIIDCGANIGIGTIFFKNQYPNAKIVAIEMEEANFKMLENNVSGYEKIFLEKAAIWSRSDIDLSIIGWDREWGYVATDNEKEVSTAKIKSLTINDIVNKHNISTISLIKIDIEGAEKEIFEKGENSWLLKTKTLIIELHDRLNSGSSKAFFDVLVHHNFSLSIQGENLIFKLNE